MAEFTTLSSYVQHCAQTQAACEHSSDTSAQIEIQAEMRCSVDTAVMTAESRCAQSASSHVEYGVLRAWRVVGDISSAFFVDNHMNVVSINALFEGDTLVIDDDEMFDFDNDTLIITNKIV